MTSTRSWPFIAPFERTIWRIHWPFYIEYCHHRASDDPPGLHTGTNNGYRWIARGERTLIWKLNRDTG